MGLSLARTFDRVRRQKAMERRVVEHVRGLLDDRSFYVPTSIGPRPVVATLPRVRSFNRAASVKDAMVAADVPSYALQDEMPLGEGLDIELARTVLLAVRQPVALVRFASLPAWKDLASGREPRPLSSEEVRQAVADLPMSKTPTEVPMTLILFSGGGFTEEARRVARGFVDGPPTILIEPNDAGGFDVTSPENARGLAMQLDPEQPAERAARVAKALDEKATDLLTGAVPLDEVAASLRLPTPEVGRIAEAWSRKRAASGASPVRVKPVEGTPMLFLDDSAADDAAASGTIGVVDRLRRIVGAPVSPQRRMAELSEQRAALTRQRDRQYDDMARLEDREAQLRQSFADESAPGTRRRITGQLLQLKKDLDRRRQTVGVLNQQIDVVGTHLHHLELARTGTTAGKLPDADELARDAAKAEEVLADLQANSELANELAGGAASASGMSDEEQKLYDELVAESAPSAEAEQAAPTFGREIPVAKPKQPATPTPSVVDEPVVDEPVVGEPEAPEPAAKPRVREAG